MNSIITLTMNSSVDVHYNVARMESAIPSAPATASSPA
jgi:hypothetical protein